MYNILIVGTGWLGLEMAGQLAKNEVYKIYGSYRSETNRQALEEKGVQPVFLDLPTVEVGTFAALPEINTLIITLPPGGRRFGDAATGKYLENIAVLAPSFPRAHIIFTSSTGVYGSATTVTVDESTAVAPNSHSTRAVVAAEEFLIEAAEKLTILRLAGLIGPGRDPANFFKPGRPLSNGLAPVNLVHRTDVIAAIELVIAEEVTGIYNVCAAAHPTKQDYYLARRKAQGLPLPTVGPPGKGGKIINAEKLRRSIDWYPVHDDLIL